MFHFVHVCFLPALKSSSPLYLVNKDIIAAPKRYSWALVMLEIGKR